MLDPDRRAPLELVWRVAQHLLARAAHIGEATVRIRLGDHLIAGFRDHAEPVLALDQVLELAQLDRDVVEDDDRVRASIARSKRETFEGTPAVPRVPIEKRDGASRRVAQRGGEVYAQGVVVDRLESLVRDGVEDGSSGDRFCRIAEDLLPTGTRVEQDVAGIDDEDKCGLMLEGCRLGGGAESSLLRRGTCRGGCAPERRLAGDVDPPPRIDRRDGSLVATDRAEKPPRE